MSSTVGPRQLAGTTSSRLFAGAGAPGLDHHLSLFGRLPRTAELIDLVERASLCGRGGAGFPTATKLQSVGRASGRPVVVANGIEAEPPSEKDRTLMRVAPHLVLDGALLAADAVGARDIIVAVSRPAPELSDAIAERARRKVDPVTVELARAPYRFVAGEETALLRALEGRPARPTLKPPYPSDRGLRGAPTLVQNVETLAHLALIARFGPEWFGSGTALATLSGAVSQPGVYEIPLGATLAEVISACGGVRAPVAAYLVGGYFGRFVRPEEAAALALTPDELGAGAIVAIPTSTCAAAECAHVIRWLAGESAGQCGPCLHGLPAIADALDVAGRGDRRNELTRLAALVERRGACRHPDGVVRLVRSALDVFADEFAVHARRRGCGRRFERVLPVPSARHR
jgi:NADH:ubiquinone oxidoreductase subunit F (NADH-binding)